jgi:hypothetical protein
VGYEEVASLKALLGQVFGLAKSKADREFAWEGDGLMVEVVANATWIVPRSPVHTGLRGTEVEIVRAKARVVRCCWKPQAKAWG